MIEAYDTLSNQIKLNKPEILHPEIQEEFEVYEEDAKKTSKTYKDCSWEEFLVLGLFLDTRIESLFSGGIDLLDDAGDIIGDIFDIF